MIKKLFKRPITKSLNPEPKDKSTTDWIIWAAWADRITFEDIKKKSNKNESEVIKIMRSSLKSNSFKLWRRRVREKSIKNRKKFEYSRKILKDKSYKNFYK